MSFSDALDPSFITSVLESTLRVRPASVSSFFERSKLSTCPESSFECEPLCDDAIAPLVSLLPVLDGELVLEDVLDGELVLEEVLDGELDAVELLDVSVELGDDVPEVLDGLVLVDPMDPLLVSLVFEDVLLVP
jgi:hypothetical protein